MDGHHSVSFDDVLDVDNLEDTTSEDDDLNNDKLNSTFSFGVNVK